MQVKLSKYYFCQGGEGATVDNLVLNTSTMNCGRVLFFKDYFALSDKIFNGNQLAYAVVPGYQIVLVFAGNLRTDSRIQLTGSTLEQLKTEMEGMAAWFHSFKIAVKPKAYRQFLLNPGE